LVDRNDCSIETTITVSSEGPVGTLTLPQPPEGGGSPSASLQRKVAAKREAIVDREPDRELEPFEEELIAQIVAGAVARLVLDELWQRKFVARDGHPEEVVLEWSGGCDDQLLPLPED
jgi:hypothetical protein